MKDKYFEVKYPNYGIEITLKNDDILLFTLYYSSKTGPCLLVEDTSNIDEIDPDKIISNISEEEKLKELVIFEEGISTVDINEQRKNLPIMIKEIKIYDSKTHGIAGNLVKYNQLVAEKYGLYKEYAYDYNLKPNIRQRKRNF